MKTLKIILVVLITGASLSATAQEKQNDATLEETIIWLNDYGFSDTKHHNSDYGEPYNLRYNKPEGSIEFIRKPLSEVAKKTCDIVLKDMKLQRVRFYKSDYSDYPFAISFGRASGKCGSYPIYFKDKDSGERAFKAFEHLFALIEWSVKIENKTVSKNKF